jgi:hypothetical protein
MSEYEATKRPKRSIYCELENGGVIAAENGEVIVLTGQRGVSRIAVRGAETLRALIDAAMDALGTGMTLAELESIRAQEAK